MDADRTRALDLPADVGIDVRLSTAGVTVTVTGDVDVHSAPLLHEALADAVSQGEDHVEVHLDGVGFMDSTGLGVLVAALKVQRARGGRLELVCGQERLLRLFAMTGLSKVFTIHSGSAEVPGSAGS